MAQMKNMFSSIYMTDDESSQDSHGSQGSPIAKESVSISKKPKNNQKIAPPKAPIAESKSFIPSAYRLNRPATHAHYRGDYQESYPKSSTATATSSTATPTITTCDQSARCAAEAPRLTKRFQEYRGYQGYQSKINIHSVFTDDHEATFLALPSKEKKIALSIDPPKKVDPKREEVITPVKTYLSQCFPVKSEEDTMISGLGSDLYKIFGASQVIPQPISQVITQTIPQPISQVITQTIPQPISQALWMPSACTYDGPSLFDIPNEKLLTEYSQSEENDNNVDEEGDGEEDHRGFDMDKSPDSSYFIDPVILKGVDLRPYFDEKDMEKVKRFNQIYKTNYQLKITDKGLYSITRYRDAEWISHEILSYYTYTLKRPLNQSVIIDGTAGVGGNTISFSKHFYKVVGVELNKIHYEVLENNVGALHLKNVDLMNESITDCYDRVQVKRDDAIFFIDPPWGGKKYKNFKHFILKVGNLYITEFIENLYRAGYPMVVVKAPLNLNINMIVGSVSYTQFKIIKEKFMMLLILS